MSLKLIMRLHAPTNLYTCVCGRNFSSGYLDGEIHKCIFCFFKEELGKQLGLTQDEKKYLRVHRGPESFTIEVKRPKKRNPKIFNEIIVPLRKDIKDVFG